VAPPLSVAVLLSIVPSSIIIVRDMSVISCLSIVVLSAGDIAFDVISYTSLLPLSSNLPRSIACASFIALTRISFSDNVLPGSVLPIMPLSIPMSISRVRIKSYVVTSVAFF
jgi:hypothetical protein